MNQNLYSVSLQQMESFFLAVELESFTKAAARLQMTQSAVSKSVAKLERNLGLTLFTRRYREISVTEAGKRLYERWRAPAKVIFEAYEELARRAQDDERKLRIGTTNTTDLSRYFWPIIDRYTKDHPEAELELSSDTMGNLVRKLAEDGLDAVFVPDFMKYRLEQLELQWKWAARDAVQVIMSAKHPLAERELELCDLEGLSIAVLTGAEYPENERFIQELFQRADCPIRLSSKRYSTPESILNFYRSEDGIMVTDRFFKLDEAAAGCVRRPLKGFQNGIICGWNPENEKKLLQYLLRSIKTT